MNPYILLVLAPLFWSGNWLIGRGLHETITPVGLNFWRWTVAFLVLLVIVSPNIANRWRLYLKHWKLLCLLGFLGIGVFQIMVYIGLSHTSAINAVVLNSTMPIFMVITSWLVLRETITWRQALGGLVSFAGYPDDCQWRQSGLAARHRILNGRPGDPRRHAHMGDLFSDPEAQRHGPDRCGNSGWNDRAGARHNGAGLCDRCLVYDNHVPATYANGRCHPLYVGVFSSVGAFYCWNEGVRGAGSNIAGFMYHLLPAFGTIGAVALLREDLFTYQIAGIALILAGVYMSTRAAPPR